MSMSLKPHDGRDSMSKAATGMRLYDTASRTVSDFKPIEAGKVSIYVCGATVQSSPHVGHIRTTLAFDVIRRWMMKLGYQVQLIRNVTDIDDKIIDKAAEAHQEWWERAYIYEQEFTAAYEALGALPPTYEPRATGHIPQMVGLIKRLIDRGHAYIIPDAQGNPSGNVYFDVDSWPEYGALTHQETGTQTINEQNIINHPINSNTIPDSRSQDTAAATTEEAESDIHKRGPRDFALWKASKPTDPITARWETPFGIGRPGWHLECSAMSRRYLGEDFDIHGGGLDLRFPHHENEMAQSRASGWGFAHRWMHTAWVTQKGEKMSKSLGNGLAISAVLSTYSAWAIRYALVSVHYRSMLEWSNQTIEDAQAAYERINGFVDRAGHTLGRQPSRQQVTELPADQLPPNFIEAMNDDIKVSEALGVVFASIRQANTFMSKDLSPDEEQHLFNQLLLVRSMLDVFGLDPLDEQWSQPSKEQRTQTNNIALASLVEQELENRAAARNVKDFAKADEIRNRLAKAGIIIEDTPTGSSWYLEQ
jgi:cysteinyl-tRNA synthetase